jgi:LysR family nitrogen assimilation transcriptional regulator
MNKKAIEPRTSDLGDRALGLLLDSRRLFYFQQVARMKSFTAAQAALDITQSTLSRQIQLLEADIGDTLLLRTGRGVELTSAGKLFLAQTDEILHRMAKAREQIQLAKSRTSGHVAIAASRPFTTHFFPSIFAKFAHAFPDADVTVFEASSGQVHQYLADSAVDLAVVLHNPNSNLIQMQRLFQEELFLVTRADQEIAKERYVCRADLTRMPLLLPAASHGTRYILDRYFDEGGVQPHARVRLDSVSLMTAMIASNAFCAILPVSACTAELNAGDFVALPLRPKLTRTLYLAWRRERAQSSAARSLAEIVYQIVESEPSKNPPLPVRAVKVNP